MTTTEWQRRFYNRTGALIHSDTSTVPTGDEVVIHLTSWPRAIRFGLKLRGDENETRVLHYHARPEGGGSFNHG